MDVQFVSQIADFQLNNQEYFRKILLKCARNENRSIRRIVYHFVSDEEILAINRNFLKHAYITDIITFDNSFLRLIEGEIFICIDEVKRNAFKHSFGNFSLELNRVILHGILHLVGYKDDNEDQMKLMRKKEEFYLQYFK